MWGWSMTVLVKRAVLHLLPHDWGWFATMLVILDSACFHIEMGCCASKKASCCMTPPSPRISLGQYSEILQNLLGLVLDRTLQLCLQHKNLCPISNLVKLQLPPHQNQPKGLENCILTWGTMAGDENFLGDRGHFWVTHHSRGSQILFLRPR